MNVTDYQIQKENQEKIFRQIGENINSDPELNEATKNALSHDVINMINLIHKQRELIYKELEGSEGADYGDHGISIFPVPNGQEVDLPAAESFMKTQLILIDQALKIEEKIDHARITNKNNDKLSQAGNEYYGEISSEIRLRLGAILHNANTETAEEPESEEKHTLSKEDIANNPELAAEGLKAGDEVTIEKGDFMGSNTPEALSESNSDKVHELVEKLGLSEELNKSGEETKEELAKDKEEKAADESSLF